MKKLFWAPGYIIIAIIYFFPTEWGKNRDVARGGRWWKYMDSLAPIISIALYIAIAIAIAIKVSTPEVKSTSAPNQSEQSSYKPKESYVQPPSQESYHQETSIINNETPPTATLPIEKQDPTYQVVESNSEQPEEQKVMSVDKKVDAPAENNIQHIPGH